MAQQLIGRGTTAGDGTGDSGYVGAGKINDNFTELYGLTNTVQNINRIISGGVVWTGSGLVYKAVNLLYEFDSQLYTLHGDTVTLNAADITDDRIDLIIIDTTGLNKITGTPSASPLEPSYDPATQIKTNIVLVQANVSVPDVTIIDVYKENTQEAGGEWDTSESTTAARIDLANTTAPLFETKDIKTDGALTGDTILFESTTPIQLVSFQNLRFNILALQNWESDQLKVTLKNSGAIVAWEMIINANLLYDPSGVPQQTEVVKFINQFSTNQTQFNEIELELIKVARGASPNNVAFQMDNISIQTGDDVTLPSGNIMAENVITDSLQFSNNLSASDNNVQKALETLDAIPNSLPGTTINGNLFLLFKAPTNNNILNAATLEVNDIVQGWWDSATFFPSAIYIGGDKDTKTSYNEVNSIEDIVTI